MILLQSGDISTNPGPQCRNVNENSVKTREEGKRRPKYPCMHCGRGIIKTSKTKECEECEKKICELCNKGIYTNSKSLICVLCNKVAHLKCIRGNLKHITWQERQCKYMCNSCCLAELPFQEEHHSDNAQVNVEICNDLNEGNEHPDITTPSKSDSKIYESFNNKGLHIIHINSRSLMNKLEEVRLLALKTNAAVMCISETWLDDSVTNNEIEISGYQVIRKDRNRNGGGVCMYIKSCLTFNQRNDIDTDGLEVIWCEVLLPKTRPIIVGCCYRPPQQNNFLDLLEENVTKFSQEDEVIIQGDMNICFLKRIGQLYKRYVNFMKMFGMEQLISEVTRGNW
ncbi:uncharacterized protein LOC123515047 [Portunus trituberculatus]|uniref:uncharacterized protein LOC123502587 n=1 Tax=Portunus trituberculatus TaxID=210409 RepID=UPI001E1D0E12|nr:uncharacterized protein LOC123502587 [Portunus trituberculatus]XP_045129377.1 uncharacterized protein LOC123515047 [Portunus trituberculatus]